MSKKMLSIILAVIMIITIVSITASAAAPSLTVKADKTSVNVGDTVVVTVSLSEKSGLGVLTVKANYDSSVLEATKMDAGSLGATVNVKTGIATMATATTFEEAGTVCTMTFKAVKTGEATVTVDVTEAYDNNLAEVKMDVVAAKVTVGAAEEPSTEEPSTDTPSTECSHETMSNWAVTTAATCKKDGVKTRNCTVCGFSETLAIPATDHSYYYVYENPTCVTDGVVYDQCKYCGLIINEMTLPATGHNYESYTYEPTCTEGGSTEFYCIWCGDWYETDFVPAKGHDYKWHTVTKATCEEDGVSVGQCSVCDHIKIEGIPATGHDYKSTVTAPTCTEQGFTTYLCHCGDTYEDDYIDALGHTPTKADEENFIAPTCTENGSIEIFCFCSVCNIEISRETVVINAVGHNYETFVTVPTCTAQGYTTYTCSCGDSYVDSYVGATGHNIIDGLCQNCGYTENTGNEDDNNDNNEVINPSDNCDCNCHKSGISKFFFDFALFFQKLFGSNKYCSCGIAHY